ncbi:uncharacterized protein LOC116351230 [Contarinia nasturtii]|uniref:uncharacterized protein LOC116351230 n=1 Tax=Contarinia nasturtii TaxID=265458 RepID=UPI0012D4A804|nr:uncharacterized protein LOC116351230 [Contarinia nasturtii]
MRGAKEKILHEIDSSSTEISFPLFNGVVQQVRNAAMQDFDAKKMGDNDASKGQRERLESDLNVLNGALSGIVDSYSRAVQSYTDSMQKSINDNEYFSQTDFMKIHQATKTETMHQFQTQPGDNEFKWAIQRKIEASIEQKFHTFEPTNAAKRQDFIQRANAHSEAVVGELKASFENKVRSGIGKSYLSDDDFFGLFSNSKQSTLQEFAARKMGNDELANQAYQSFREKLERDIDSLQITLKQVNEANKPPPKEHKKSGWVKFRDGVISAVTRVGVSYSSGGLDVNVNNG